MSLQDSTFNTTHVMENEIVKANDFEFAFQKLIENVSKSTQMILESNQDFVINGFVIPYQGMNVKISPIYGVCKSTGIPFGRTEEAIMEYGFEESSSGRVDIIEVKGEWETFDEQQRAFNDPDTNIQTYQYVDTKKLMRPVYRIKQGIEGANTAPEHDAGWVKLAEVVIRPNVVSLEPEDIKNITSDIAGENNEDWTNEINATYNIGYISDVNARFRQQHNSDGTHKDNVINTDSLNIGIGSKQINGNVLPVGGNISIPTQSITPTDSLLSVYSKIAIMITSFYNLYIKFGNYGFKGSLSLSDLADDSNSLENPLVLQAAGDGTATFSIGGNVILSIDAEGKLSTNGYTATSPNHIITKAVADAIRQEIAGLNSRLLVVENKLLNTEIATNNVISTKFSPDSTSIYVATTSNITLQGVQTVDGLSVPQGVNVLVKNQTDPKQNGIYVTSSNSIWLRLSTFVKPSALVGKIFTVQNGTANSGKMFYTPRETFVDSTEFGTDEIPFSEYSGSTKGLANKLIMRDANGRAQVAAPSASCDIARKQEIDNLYGNTVGTALGTAAVGTATTFARSDHVHPIPYCLHTSSDSAAWYVFSRYNICSDSRYLIDISNSCDGTSRYGVHVAYADSATSATSAGTATSATNATNSTCLGGRSTSQYMRNCNGKDLGVNANLGTYHTMTQGGPNSCWNHIISMGWSECAGTDSWATQITIPSYNSPARMGYRCHNNNTTNNSWQGWRYLIDTAGGQTISGSLTACCFCGALCGTACYATTAGSATSATSAGNASCLGGYSLSESATGDTVVKRTSGGYINAAIFHDCWNAENIASYTSNVVFKSSDGYLRNTSKANFQSWLGLGGAAYCSVKAAVSTASHTDYNNNQGVLPTMNFLSYWNGAYNSNGSSNLSYTAVGKLGSAAACAATAFRASTWTPYCVACAGHADHADSAGVAFLLPNNVKACINYGVWHITVPSSARKCDVWKAICCVAGTTGGTGGYGRWNQIMGWFEGHSAEFMVACSATCIQIKYSSGACSCTTVTLTSTDTSQLTHGGVFGGFK